MSWSNARKPVPTHERNSQVLMSLYRNEHGQISINTLFDLVMRQVHICFEICSFVVFVAQLDRVD